MSAISQAVWTDCAGIVNGGREAHAMRDYCSSCGPWWERVPACPHCGAKLLKMGRTKCKGCQRFVLVGEGR